MTNEVKWLLEELIKYGLGFTVAGVVFYMLVTRWLSSYLNEKGKNLATKEDVTKITDLVKGVEHQYNVLLEEMKSKQQLRMAALDKRLQAHQDAFTLWTKLVDGGPYAPRGQIALECQDWWQKNCLYLEPDVRQNFVVAYHNAFWMEQNVTTGANGITGATPETIMSAWSAITQFQALLFKSIQLPALTPTEQDVIKTS
jgi:hypothetical protein